MSTAGGAMHLYFVRHGESVANVERFFSHSGDGAPLTEKGRRQAQALAATLADKNIRAVYTSPLIRARETAAPIAGAAGVEPVVTEALREYSVGELEGRRDPESWERHAEMAGLWLSRTAHWHRRLPGGESLIDMRARFLPFVEEVLASDISGGVAVVAHAGLYRTMLPLVLSNVSFRFTAVTGADAKFSNDLRNTEYVSAERVGRRLVCREWAGIEVPDGHRLGHDGVTGPLALTASVLT